MHILLLAAMAQEAEGFLPGAGERHDGWPAVRTVPLAGHDISVATTGVGKVNVSAAAALLFARRPAGLMLMIGTAGKIADVAGDCFWLAHAVQHDYGRRTAAGFVHYDPGALPFGPSVIMPFAGMPDPGTGLPHATIVSGDSFVEDPAFAAHLAATLGATLVDMETAALAQVADRLGVPWAGIKATTDEADDASHGDFMANLRHAARRAGEAAERLITLL